MTTFTNPADCGYYGNTGRCCIVIYSGASGANCAQVPIWDLAPIFNTPGGSLEGLFTGLTPSFLCTWVHHNWASRLAPYPTLNPEVGATLGDINNGSICCKVAVRQVLGTAHIPFLKYCCRVFTVIMSSLL